MRTGEGKLYGCLSAGEIRTMYAQAANRREQLIIIRQLTLLSRDEIMRIIEGEILPDIDVGEWRKKMSTKNYIWTKNEVKQLTELREQGKTAREIAQIMGIDQKKVESKIWQERKKQKEMNMTGKTDAPKPTDAVEPAQIVEPTVPPAETRESREDEILRLLRMALDAAYSIGIVPREVEICYNSDYGFPTATAQVGDGYDRKVKIWDKHEDEVGDYD